VAVVDGAGDTEHPDLDASVGIDCVGEEQGPPPDDPDTHGTHVAGIVGARNNGSGVVGVAPGTEVVGVRVLGRDGTGLTSELMCGIEWVTATRTDDDPDNDIAVANMSLGGLDEDFGPCPDEGIALHAVICAADAAGVTLVAAAGNDTLAFDQTGEVDEDDGTPAWPRCATTRAAWPASAPAGPPPTAGPSCSSGLRPGRRRTPASASWAISGGPTRPRRRGPTSATWPGVVPTFRRPR
jgi:subtilisin family serine protease